MNRRSSKLSHLALCVGFLVGAGRTSNTTVEEGFRVPDGFAVSQFADDALAHDIYSMTIDPQGRVVVAGPGYIKILHDDNDDGVADRASLFSDFPKSGAQGMCFAGDELWVTGDGALLRIRDANRDGVADGPGEELAKLRNGEHGSHAVLQGPDGWFYVVCGNDSGLSQAHVKSSTSPVEIPRSGGILRVSPDGRRHEVVAHGFRNPYDIDFTPAGQLLTADSDGERDQHLPWYEPTRMFDVAQGMEHGWLEGGHTKSWSRPEYFFDNVDRVCEFGRGSPTGLTVYRHRQFPEHYRGGAFAACWTFGRVYFVPLVAEGSTLRGKPEVFASTIGENGFAPVDLAVDPSGDLFVAIGGRKTRGGVYRIRYADAKVDPPAELDSLAAKLTAVLAADQPLSSWSRARWIPLADELGPQAFAAAALNAKSPDSQRVRAIEVLTERFRGVPLELAAALVEQNNPSAMSRMAWSIARVPEIHDAKDDTWLTTERLLARLTHHESPTVQRAAWEALDPLATPDWSRAMNSSDRRIRSAMIALARGSRRNLFADWAAKSADSPSSWSNAAQLRIAGTFHAEKPRERSASCAAYLALFSRANDTGAQLEALRLFQLALGDIRLDGDPRQGIPGYRAADTSWLGPNRNEWVARLSSGFSMGDKRVDRELARTLAMLQSAPASVTEQIAKLADAQPSASESLHYLFALAHLPGDRTPECTKLTAQALATLNGKLASRQEFPSRNWGQMVEDAFDRLIGIDKQLADTFIASAEFGRPEHVLFLAHLPIPLQKSAAERLFQRARVSNDEEAWTPELIAALRNLPEDTLNESEVITSIREQWDDFRVRDAIALWLAGFGRQEDRERLVEVLGSPERNVVQRSAKALATMPAPGSEAEIVAAMGALRQSWAGSPRTADAKSTATNDRQAKLEDRLWEQGESLRTGLDQLLRHWANDGKHLPPQSQQDYQAWLSWFHKAYPAQAQQFANAAGTNAEAWTKRLAILDWTSGNPTAGEQVFEKQTCHRCHRGDNRLGPDLAGAAQRMTREDLFAAIYDPQREVAPPYRTTLIATRSGQVHHGLVVYESPDGTLLQTAPDTTVRVTGDELLSMQPSNRSLMPTGLLDPFSDRELCDLAAYLGSLQAIEKSKD